MSESSPAACFAAWRLTKRRSASVHFLFLISSEVIFVSPSRRDDAGDFFAIDFLPVNMNNEQHDCGIRAQSSRPNRVPSLFSGFVHTVWTDKAAFVFKGQSRHFE